MESLRQTSDDEELEGWKEIGNYLGVSERTAQRYGRDLKDGQGLVVRKAIPTFTNFRLRRVTTVGAVRDWKRTARVPELELAERALLGDAPPAQNVGERRAA